MPKDKVGEAAAEVNSSQRKVPNSKKETLIDGDRYMEVAGWMP